MKNLILPALTILIGAGSAFGTQQMKKTADEAALVPGYIYSSVATRCLPVKMCSDIQGDICTVDDLPTGQPVHDLNTSGDFSTCNVTLFKP